MSISLALLTSLILFAGSFIQGSASFGFGLFTVGLLTLFLSVKQTTLLVLTLSTLSSVGIVWKYRQHIVLKQLYGFTLFAILGRAAAFFFLEHYGESLWIKKVLGLLLIGLVIHLFFGRKQNKHDQTDWKIPGFAPFAGMIGGFLGGAFAIGGPLFVMYFLLLFQDKREYMANLHLISVMLNVLTIFIHGLNGDLSGAVWIYVLPGAVAVWLGVSVGLKCYDKLPRHWIQQIACFIVLLSGLNILLFS